jgi:hypothetical protein
VYLHPLLHLPHLHLEEVLGVEGVGPLLNRSPLLNSRKPRYDIFVVSPKARLHVQFLLWFLVRFSSADGCERV